MGKWIRTGTIIVILFGVLMIYLKDIYYPALPIDSVSKSEVINKVNKSNGNIVKITVEDSYQWYISEMKQGRAYENLKRLMKDKGWFFKEQLGPGFVFQNEQGEIMVSSEMWTRKYVIFHFPKGI